MTGKKKFVPTEDALALTQEIAHLLNMPFDKGATQALSLVLLERYFNDIAQVLPEETKQCQFESFAMRDFSAFVEPLGKVPLINLDEQWSLFLWTANILVCIRTCIVLKPHECEQTSQLFKQNLSILLNPYYHETLREKMRPYLLNYAQVLPLANLITRSMLGFMICHEIAHAVLGHLERAQTRAMELEADSQGFIYLHQVGRHFEKLKFFKVPPNTIGAPIIGMMYLQALEKSKIIPAGTIDHPSATQRRENLCRQFNTIADKDARYLYEGLEKGCSELLENL